MIIVADPVAARRALAGRQLRCPKPGCTGRLRPWTAARTRSVHGLGGIRLRVRPDRGRCTTCRSTEVLLPAVCLPRRAYTADVVGAVLLDAERGQPVAQTAATQLVPVSTARRWVRAVVGSADAVTAAAVRAAVAAGDAIGCRPQFGPVRPVGALTEVLRALDGAAAVWTAGRAIPRTGVFARSGAVTGIDYLALVHRDYHQGVLRDLGVADPADALGATVTGWPLVNAITGGRLLTTPG